MAYSSEDYLVNVRGVIGGSEAFSNTWAFLGTGVLLDDIDTIGGAIAGFYEDICGFASWLSENYKPTGAVLKQLVSGQTFELPWPTLEGSSSGEMLPTQLAVRVSLTAAPNIQGGPYLGGFVVAAVDGSLVANSLLTDFKGALETMTAALTAGGCALGLHRPTVETVELVIQGRQGQRWDVINKRANDTPEGYTTFALT